jgi:hypothetical protein
MKTAVDTRPQEEWVKALKEALQKKKNPHAKKALKGLEAAGCTQANLFGFMYAFHRAQALVFKDRNRTRNRAFSGLAGVVRLLTRGANSLKDTFDISMSGEEKFGDWLRERLTLTRAELQDWQVKSVKPASLRP